MSLIAAPSDSSAMPIAAAMSAARAMDATRGGQGETPPPAAAPTGSRAESGPEWVITVFLCLGRGSLRLGNFIALAFLIVKQ